MDPISECNCSFTALPNEEDETLSGAASPLGFMEGSKVRRRAESMSNAIQAPKSVPNTPQTAHSVYTTLFSTPQGRDVLDDPGKATFYNPAPADGVSSVPRRRGGEVLLPTWYLAP